MWEHLYSIGQYLWKHLSSNREIVINALDLISFVLVTPELAKFGNVGIMLVSTVMSSLVLFALFTSVSYSFSLVPPGNTIIYSTIMLIMAIIYGYIFLNYRRILLFIYDKLSGRMFFWVLQCSLFLDCLHSFLPSIRAISLWLQCPEAATRRGRRAAEAPGRLTCLGRTCPWQPSQRGVCCFSRISNHDWQSRPPRRTRELRGGSRFSGLPNCASGRRLLLARRNPKADAHAPCYPSGLPARPRT
jgi:hypothetical protein